jgi:hypothetical protein
MNTAYPHPCKPRPQPPLDLHGVLTYREHGASERASGGPPEGSAKDDREGHPLQNVKGQGLCWSWRNWLEDQLGLAEKSVEEFWAVLQSLGPGLREDDELVDAGGGAVAQAALDLGSR